MTSPDASCAIVVNGLHFATPSLPCTIVYHGRVYLLAVSEGRRQGLILTKPDPAQEPPEKKV